MSNPFDLLEGTLNGMHTVLRPVAFNDDEYDKDYRRTNGELIRPILAVATCPQCGQLIEQGITEDQDLAQTIPVYCESCHPFVPAPPPPSFPFRDPIGEEVVTLFDINPMALSNLDLFFGEGEQTEQPEIPTESPLVERRSGGLGQFIRRRDQWKKITDKVDEHLGPGLVDTEDTDPSGDLFDMMGEMSEHFSEPSDEPTQ